MTEPTRYDDAYDAFDAAASDDAGLPSPPGTPEAAARPRRARRAVLGGLTTCALLGVGGIVWAQGAWRESAAPPVVRPGATAEVTRGDLTVSASLDGTLAFAGSAQVYAPGRTADEPRGGSGGSGGTGGGTKGGGNGNGGTGGGTSGGTGGSGDTGGTTQGTTGGTGGNGGDRPPSGPGTLSGLPTVGQAVKRGEPMYHVDGRPVPLFYGDAPLWRNLAEGVANGKDVRLLELNLAALGHGASLKVDDRFTEGTTTAIKRWQKASGVPQTGRVSPADVSVQPDAVRVTAVKATLGAPAQGEIASVSGQRRVVTVKLPVDRQTLVKQGVPVTVVLPGDKSTPGTVARIGTVVSPDGGDGGGPGGGKGGGGGSTGPTLPVEITLDRPEDVGALDGAPVTVRVVSETRKDVLSLPVNALLALAEGGYGVEVVDPSGFRHVVAVRTGLFANNRVEVTGDGLAPGTKVRVPAS